MQHYCFDSSAFIEGWRRLYPPDSFEPLWVYFGELTREGRLLAPYEVYREIQKQQDDLHAWVKEREKTLFYPDDEPIQLATRDVLSDFERLTDTSKYRDRADPFVIALARITDRIVVSEEPPGGPNRPRIPDVCRAYGIRCITLSDFIREEKLRFSLVAPR